MLAAQPYWGYLLFFNEIDIQTEALELFHHDVERFREPRFEQIIAFDDRFVHARAPDHVVGLHREHLLQRVRGALSFQRPDFHFTEALAAKLRLSAQRLLGHQTGRPR